MKNPKTGQIEDTAEPSFFVLVPEQKQTAANGRPLPPDTGSLPLIPPALIGTDQRLPPQPGVGRLRELGQ